MSEERKIESFEDLNEMFHKYCEADEDEGVFAVTKDMGIGMRTKVIDDFTYFLRKNEQALKVYTENITNDEWI